MATPILSTTFRPTVAPGAPPIGQLATSNGEPYVNHDVDQIVHDPTMTGLHVARPTIPDGDAAMQPNPPAPAHASPLAAFRDVLSIRPQ